MSRHTDRGSRENAELLAFHLKTWDPEADPTRLIESVRSMPGIRRVEFNPGARRIIVLGTVDTALLKQVLGELGLELQEEAQEKRPEAVRLRLRWSRPNFGEWLIGSRTWLRSLLWIVPASFLVGVLLSIVATAPGPVPTPWLLAAGVALFGSGVLLGGRRVLKRFEGVRETYLGRVDTALLLSIVLIAQVIAGAWLEALLLLLLYGAVQLLPGFVVRRLEQDWIRPLEHLPKDVSVLTGPVGEGDEPEVAVIPVEQVSPGDVLRAREGDVVACDGRVEKGSQAVINTFAVTGESIPSMPVLGALVPAGSKVESGELYLRVERPFAQGILFGLRPKDMFHERALELLSGRFAALLQYLPQTIIYVATAVMLLPPLLFGEAIGPWLHRGLAILLIAPINTVVFSLVGPLIAAFTRMAELGTAFKSRKELADMGRTTLLALSPSLVIDPRHTLTRIDTYGQLTEDDALRIASAVLGPVDHPWAAALTEAANGQGLDVPAPIHIGQFDGEGIGGTLRTGNEDDQFLVGTTLYMQSAGVELPPDLEEKLGEAVSEGSYLLWLAYRQRVLAGFFIQCRVKDGTRRLVQKLRKSGIRSVHMLSTQQAPIVEQFAAQAGLDGGRGDLTVDELDAFMAQWQEQGEVVAYAGAQSDGAGYKAPTLLITLGSDRVDAVADGQIHMVSGDLFQLHPVFHAAKRLRRVSRNSIVLALAAKLGMGILAVQTDPVLWLMGVFEAAAAVGVATLVLLSIRRA